MGKRRHLDKDNVDRHRQSVADDGDSVSGQPSPCGSAGKRGKKQLIEIDSASKRNETENRLSDDDGELVLGSCLIEETNKESSFALAFNQLRSIPAEETEKQDAHTSLPESVLYVPSSAENNEESKPAITVEEQCIIWGLDKQIGRNITTQLGIERFFPIQTKAISQFLNSDDNDLCICAPTGSGKTLIFAIPVVGALFSRVVCRLRALVILPTRELALQCFSVFESLVVDTSLKVSVTIGQNAGRENESDILNCDVLVCTPGRLMDHLKMTPGFTLEHLTFLIIDEADRLLSQHYQGWLSQIYAAAYQKEHGRISTEREGDETRVSIKSVTRRRFAENSVEFFDSDEPVLRRILCSATLTRNPQKLESLRLRRPINIALRFDEKQDFAKEDQSPTAESSDVKRFSLPDTLTNHTMLCTSAQKPTALLQLLNLFADKPTLVFVSSVEATHRLAVFLQQFLGSSQVSELSSFQKQKERVKILRKFRSFAETGLTVLVVSDVMSRGIDLDELVNVVNYDVPEHVRAFVHRVGRVARAGRHGYSYSLLRTDQLGNFRRLLAKVRHQKPISIDLDAQFLKENSKKVESCLIEMKKILRKEKSQHR